MLTTDNALNKTPCEFRCEGVILLLTIERVTEVLNDFPEYFILGGWVGKLSVVLYTDEGVSLTITSDDCIIWPTDKRIGLAPSLVPVNPAIVAGINRR